MIVVTGGAGFIGSNLVQAINRMTSEPCVVVDDLSDGHKFRNIADLAVADYFDRDEFLSAFAAGALGADITAVFHQGACSETTEWDGRYMMDNNFRYSKALLHQCLERAIPFIYASSAAVYGGATAFSESPANETPLNVYGYSKLLFDQYVRRVAPAPASPVVGLRYFNVYGPREQHKDSMASVAWHFNRQLTDKNECQLFAGCDGYADGEQRRDFVYVDDVCAVNLWFLEQRAISGIFNCGTGRSQTFNNVADAVIAHRGGGEKRYIEFPQHLVNAYQSFTEADLQVLRASGYQGEFRTVEQGVSAYMKVLDAKL